MPYESIFRPGLFAGQSVLVTGGGSGIGRCTAHELVALGAKVALVGRKMEKLEAVAREIAEVGGTATTHSCDIRDEDAVRKTVTDVLAAHGRIDGLVNNAGGQFPAPLKDISGKGWDAVVRNNLTGCFLMSREVYNQTMAANGGAMVNMLADIWMGMPGMGHSGASRGGILNFTETAALEWAPVRVNAVAPGLIASSGLDTYDEPFKKSIRERPRQIPLRRFGTESEVSAAIVFLLSPAAAFISGVALRIDGAVPNAKRIWPLVGNGGKTAAFNGFHLAAFPEVLKGVDGA
ncbi:MAG: SDR family oxidoreductase [Burkholderiales bacterium]|nr:SDR family oxidoreductase [Burkholderiales bacterium]